MKVPDMTQVDYFQKRAISKNFSVCDQSVKTAVWGYIIAQQGLPVILETSSTKAIDGCSIEMPDPGRNCSRSGLHERSSGASASHSL
jgi:hypothetical protein